MNRLKHIGSLMVIFTLAVLGQENQATSSAPENVQEEKSRLLVGVGDLVQSEPSVENMGSVLYKITEKDRGDFIDGEVHIVYFTNTLNNPLPAKAVLLATPFFPITSENTDESWGKVCRALGTEAWRGIVPYSVETWERIKKTSSEELQRTPLGQELSRDVAINMALQEVDQRGGMSEHNRIHSAKRLSFGWMIGVLVVTPNDKGGYLASKSLVQVGDTGEVLNYIQETCGSMYVRIGSEESIEEKLDAFFGTENLEYESIEK